MRPSTVESVSDIGGGESPDLPSPDPADPTTGSPVSPKSPNRTPIVVVGAVAVAFILLVAIVALAHRSTDVGTTVAAAEGIPTGTLAETTTQPADTEPAPPDTDAPETTTTDGPEVPIDIPHPSTVLIGKTQGNIQVFNSPGGSVKSTLPNPRPLDTKPPASINLYLLAKQVQGDWVEVYMPVRPNGSTGWVHKSDFDVSTHDYHIEVRLKEFNIKVFNGTQKVMDTSIGVAADNSPTPGGLYYTTELLKPPDGSGPYGTYAYGLSGFSDVYQSFDGGPGQLGLHGTNEPWSIGTKVSHGCIRLRNADIETLAKMLPLAVPVLVYR
jgi:hypothetical protein